ncbi:restriction endonuclease subunit S [Bacteroides stercoris]|uniref:restriction endonuclease subunit S n=1 Tax=Bacteroides stercoris TaxID=46506 RepID=UPI00216B6793|nr:restriction endonuclease subunit S [Bacteroides stercoris]
MRFPEFSGEWKCTTIGNIGDIKNGPFGSVLHAEDYVENGIPIVTTEHFKTGLMPSDKFGIPQVSNEDYIRLKGYRLETNDIVFSRVGSVDINAHVGIEQNGWLFSGRVLRVRPKYDIDSLFLHYALSTEAVKRDIRNRAVGQTMPSINTPILSSTTIQLPKDLFEQKKVAHFLRLLDERIITQNKIIEDLKKLKSAISLNVLHSDKWEQFKIKDIAQIGRGRVISSIEIGQQKSPTYPVYSSQTSNDGIMGYLDDYMFEGEYISWTTDGANAGTVFYRNGKFNCTNVCGLLKLRKEFDTHFVSLVLAEATKKYVSINLANPKLMNNTMGNIQIRLPKLEEQKRISIVFRVLQRLWTVHNSLLTEYTKQEQYLLSQMFI